MFYKNMDGDKILTRVHFQFDPEVSTVCVFVLLYVLYIYIYIYIYMWQFHVEIEGYSVAYFDRIRCVRSAVSLNFRYKGGAYTRFVDA